MMPATSSFQLSVTRPAVRFASQASAQPDAPAAPKRVSTYRFIRNRGLFAPVFVPLVGVKLLGVKTTFGTLFKGGGFEGLLKKLEYKLQFIPPKDPELYHSQMQKAEPRLTELDIPVKQDGIKIKGWYIAPKNQMPTILFAPGKQGHAGKEGLGVTFKLIDAAQKRGFGVLTPDYRGFGKSEGVPSEAGFYNDLRAASDYLAEKLDTPVSNQIAFGFSLGGAIVSEIAQDRPFKGVALAATFTDPMDTIPSLQKYLKIPKFVPMKKWARRLSTLKMDSINKVPRFQSPLLVFHGNADNRVSHKLGEKLFEAGNPQFEKQLKLFEGATHTTIFDHSEAMIDDVAKAFCKDQTPPATTEAKA